VWEDFNILFDKKVTVKKMPKTRILVSSAHKRFGGIRAIDGVSLEISEGDIYGLIGPNGSGKTTLINVISGVYQLDSGEVQVDGKKITGQSPYADCFHCLTRSFQIPKLWSKLSVLSNLMIAAMGKNATLNLSEAKEKALQMLDRLDLGRLMNEPANTLSGGQLKLLEFGRALVHNSKVILLDEPFAGVFPNMQPMLIEIMQGRARTGTSFLVVSHVISRIAEVSDRLGVLNRGRLIAEGTPAEVFRDKSVIEAYLGGKGVA
jgi:branched-chain amino acid transport system ATP-binding protein